ncbi:hypothetical protein PP459_gp196 [Streptomyces phage Wakanda]|uniref:Transmembrane protein n=1 Tax=Streptomyces phage Wakanda TaxID=2713267 RepID=A0A6G8R251_9CAUD|nr:hypothetical protein PP459_gp196 [Streptomyces phage Wakanda]QIN94038.1 hypothetical protein SEA_WAKANDA_45 [Streptomyces phage Wakanda]
MKKALITMGLVPIMLALVLFVSPKKAYAQDCESTTLGTICASLVGNDVVVTLLGQEIARISAPVREVEVQVPVPGPTDIIRVPGPTRTVTVPGPTKTVAVPVPGSNATATATVTLRPSGQSGARRDNIEPSTTPSAGKTPGVTPTVTVTKTASPKVVVDEREKKVRVTIPQAIGISVGLLLLGLLLGLLALYTAYTVGYKNSEQAEAKAWRRWSDDLFGKKGKH